MKHHNMHSVVSKNDARIEAHASRNRGDKSATIWGADVEVRTVDDTRTGILAFIDELRRLIAKKVSLNVGHIYASFGMENVFLYGFLDMVGINQPIYMICDHTPKQEISLVLENMK